MINNIKIGVVIVNYNSASYLLKAVHFLSKQTFPPTEVIIYDNASSEKIPDDLYQQGINVKVILASENTGFAGGNNRAIQQLNKEINWIALLNPDAYPEPNWLEEMVNAIVSYPQYTFFGSKLVCETEPKLLDGTGDAYHLSGKAWRMNHKKPIAAIQNEVKEIFSPCAAAALYRRDIFESIDGFDERFFCYYEDIDLAFRLRLLGHKCCYIPTAVVAHTGSATTTRHSEFYTYYGHRNLVWTYAKNMPLTLLLLSLPLHLALNIASIILLSYRGQLKTIFRAKRDAFKLLHTVFKHRRIWQKKRILSNWDLLKILHKGFPW